MVSAMLDARLHGVLSEVPEVGAAYLFGSRAGSGGRLDSDVDVAVLFRPEVDAARRFQLRCELGERLASAAGTERADVVDLEAAPPLLAREVLRHGRLLLSRDEAARVAVVARQTMRYIDTRPLRRVLDEATFRRIREGSFGRLP